MDNELVTLRTKAGLLESLHTGQMLVLPNVWDAASAKTVAAAAFPAVATASAAVSAVLGYEDEEQAPYQEMFAAAARIARSVSVPVTVDAEAGYGIEPGELVERILETGAVGCNLEDTDHRAGAVREVGAHATWLGAVRSAAEDAGVPLVINARVDAFLPASGISEEDRVREALRRGRAYRSAGASCIYPIGMRNVGDIEALVTGLGCPVNANPVPGVPLATLQDLGVARVSFGPYFYRKGLADFASAIAAL